MTLTSLRHGLCAVAAIALVFSVASTAEARPQYNKEFKAQYADKFAEGTALKCDVCHGKSKKKLSQYGMDMKSKLGGKNVKDADAVKAAFEAVSSMDSQTEGKTYGDLIESGTLPAPFSE